MQVWVSIVTKLLYCRGVCVYCKTNKFVFADFATFIYLFIHFLSCSCKALNIKYSILVNNSGEVNVLSKVKILT